MPGSINAARHPADDHESLGGEIARQAFGHPGTVGSWMSRANDRNARLIEQFSVTSNIKKKRRIVDLLQARRIEEIVLREDRHPLRRGACHFLAC
jgi:hypothetical protein